MKKNGRRYCVGIETASLRLGLALYDISDLKNPEKVSTFSKDTGVQQSDLLIPELKNLLKKARVDKTSLELLVVDVGPGSFTGVRVGVSAARAMAQSLKIPLMGISSLEAMAWLSRQSRADEFIFSVMPALPGDVYFSIFRPIQKNKLNGFSSVLKPCWASIKEFSVVLENHPSAAIVVESWNADLESCRNEFPKRAWLPGPVLPQAWACVEVALNRLRSSPSKKFSFEKVVPLYLQPSWAERNR